MLQILKSKYFKYTIIILFVLCVFFIPLKKGHNVYPSMKSISGDTLVGAIMLDRSLYSKSYSIGYFYSILPVFESFKQCKVKLKIVHDSLEYHLDELIKNKNSFLIINAQNDTIPDKYKNIIFSSKTLSSKNDIRCLTTKENTHIIQNINAWFAFFKQTKEYNNILNRYHNNYTIGDNFGAPLSKKTISPYDNFVKKYAKILGWDWRLICSIMYQESKFKMGVKSKMGAIGLMQIKEDVAQKYNIEDIYDPEQNIKAGILHLERIQKKYIKQGVDSSNIIPITLAAYNCGEGRMKDCMTLAKQSNLNPLEWNSLKQVIPMLREEQHYSKEYIQFGKFHGQETLKFVSNILDRYNRYKESVNSN